LVSKKVYNTNQRFVVPRSCRFRLVVRVHSAAASVNSNPAFFSPSVTSLPPLCYSEPSSKPRWC